MSGQMSWLSSFGTNGQKILHLRENPLQPWLPYTAFPQYKVPDLTIPGASKGWTTYQKLREAGWALIASAEAQASTIVPNRLSA